MTPADETNRFVGGPAWNAATDVPVPATPLRHVMSGHDYPVPPPQPRPVRMPSYVPVPAYVPPPALASVPAPVSVPAPAPAAAAAPQPDAPASTHKTLLFANDKSSGKTTTANAVLVSLLDRYPVLMRSVAVREYDRQPRLATVFGPEDGLGAMLHFNARNAEAYDEARAIAGDPNATPWDDLLFSLGSGGLLVDLGANIFSEICRILDEEPRPLFPDGGEALGLVVPVTTAGDSIDSAITAIEAGLSWGPKVTVFAMEQEYLGRFDTAPAEWAQWRDRMLATEGTRFQALRMEKLQVADIGGVVFQRIDRMVAQAQEMLRSTRLEGAEYIRAIRKARAEVAWGARTLSAVQPIADWFAR